MEAPKNPPQPKDEKGSILRATGVVGGATLASRVCGYLRDMVTALLFGAEAVTDAFFLAFRIPNTLRRLFAEGALTIAFIPVFTEQLTRGPRSEADTLGRSTGLATFLILSLLSLLGLAFAPWIVKLFAYGFTYDPSTFRMAVDLTRVVFPYILLVGMVAWAMGVLNSFKHFFAPAFSPVLLNLSMITGAFLLAPFFRQPIFGLAVGVILGGILQILLQLPFLSRTGFRFRGPVNLFHPGLKRIFLLMLPAMFGLAVYQLNVLIGTLLASFLPRGSISFLYYADRIIEVPMGVFAIALATAVLPTMSEKTAVRDYEGLKETLGYSLRFLLFIIVPATLALIALRVPIVNVLFERGKFGAEETRLTAQAILAYGLGLPAFAGVRIVVPAFYSLQDTKTPVRVAVAAFLLNLALSLILMSSLRHAGLALATSLSAFLNLALLFYFLHRKLGSLHLSGLLRPGGKILAATFFMTILLWFGTGLVEWSKHTGFLLRLGVLSLTIALGGGSYLLFSRLWKIEELDTFIKSFRRRTRR